MPELLEEFLEEQESQLAGFYPPPAWLLLWALALHLVVDLLGR